MDFEALLLTLRRGSLLACLLFVSLWGLRSEAQVKLQRETIKGISYATVPIRGDFRKCIQWGTMGTQNPDPIYTEGRQPFVFVTVNFLLNGQCSVKITPEENMTIRKDVGNRYAVTFKFRPPLKTFRVEGPGFEHNVVVEAPLEEIAGSQAFSFLKRSEGYFGLKYFNWDSSDKSFPAEVREYRVAPMVEGELAVPTPISRNFLLAFKAQQVLTNWLPGSEFISRSEASLGTKLRWAGSFGAGRPLVDFHMGFLGYQDFQKSAQSPYRGRGIVGLTTGLTGSWFPFGSFMPPDRFLARIALNFHYTYASELGSLFVFSKRYQILEGALHYQITSKWGVALGYAKHDRILPTITNSNTSFFLRLALAPFVEEKYWE